MQTNKKFIEEWKKFAQLKNANGLLSLLDESVKVISPIMFKTLEDRREISAIFHSILKVLPDMHYHRCETTETGAIMLFKGTVDGKLELEGIDVFTVGNSGKATELKVFVRPLKAAMAFAEKMKAALASGA